MSLIYDTSYGQYSYQDSFTKGIESIEIGN